MSDEQTTDNGNRATVAQTLAEVRGLRDFIDASFKGQQQQLDQLTGLPVKVGKLETALAALDERERQADEDADRRMSALEQGKTRSADWRGRLFIGVVCSMPSLLALVLHFT